MMRKTLWIVAVVFAIYGTQIATAQTSITFEPYGSGGATTPGTLTVTGSNFSLSIDGDTFTTTNPMIETDLTQSCTTFTPGTNACEWILDDNIFTVFSGNPTPTPIYLNETSPTTSQSLDGQGYYPNTAVPEPNVYLLALLGVFFTRNRISQGLRQAIRWNYRLPALH